MIIRDYDAARHERFSAGYPINPIRNDSFFLSEFDFSGVGWRGFFDTSVTMISPQHFVSVTHAFFDPGQTINFFNRLGELKSYTVEAVHAIRKDQVRSGNSDLTIGTLTAPISAADEIASYPLLRLPQESDYAGQSLVVYGFGGRVGTNVVDSVGSGGIGSQSGDRVMNFSYVHASGAPDDAQGEPGDSGSPSFIVADGQLALVGTTSGGAEGPFVSSNIHTFIPRYLDRLNDEMASTAFGVTTIPSSAMDTHELILEFLQDGTNDVLATAQFAGTLPFDRFELQSLEITAAGSAALETPDGTQLPIGQYEGTFSSTSLEFSLDALGTTVLSGRLTSKDAPDKFGGNTGRLQIESSLISLFDDTIPGPSLPSPSFAAGQWVKVVPEPSAMSLALLGLLVISPTLRLARLFRHSGGGA